MITVVCAVILWKNRIFLEQRQPDKEFPLHWACPGGKVEEGETDHGALSRELWEELRIGALPIDPEPIAVNEFEPPKMRVACRVKQYVMRVKFQPPVAPNLQAAVGCGWFTSSELDNLHKAPSLDLNLEVIRAAMMTNARR
jgi:8-oxo-dGTP pyrophosphatase MutT (NUDIX family)